MAQLWQAIPARAAVPAAKRHPVLVYIDEVQDYLHLPTDLGDALAQARGFGVGFTLAHQFLGQLPLGDAGALCGQCPLQGLLPAGAGRRGAIAKGHPELAPEDFTSLGQFQVYASLFARGSVTPYASGAKPAVERPSGDTQQIKQAQPPALRPAAG